MPEPDRPRWGSAVRLPSLSALRRRLGETCARVPASSSNYHEKEGDTFKDAIAQRVVESYPPLYRPSENGHKLPRLLRKPLGAQEDAIKGAALSLEAHRGTTVVGEMGSGKAFIAAAAAHMAGFKRILVLGPPHLVPKWKREVEMTVPGARAVIVKSITDLERLRLSVGSGPRQLRNLPLQLRDQPHQLVALRGREVFGLTHSQRIKT